MKLLSLFSRETFETNHVGIFLKHLDFEVAVFQSKLLMSRQGYFCYSCLGSTLDHGIQISFSRFTLQLRC